MDVTSLLNAGSLAVEQKRLEGLRIGRNRTPWDAGGYSLPITTKTPISPPNQPHQDNYFDDRPMDAPSSPRHKLSDSRSSLSSFASSIQSTTHSRFSSMSTASGSHSLNTITGELISPKTMTMELASPSVTNPPEVMALDSRTKDAGIDEACEILAPIAENRLSPEDSTEEPNKAHLGYPRPSSPSDAILIKRASVPSLRLDTREGSSSVTPQQL
ncbi:hypothetical protein HYFRA_00004117 [Hymenoscyphus fraxineus]|uniref:Uncharacterized protein n=1 Tax=Hymenoscyphus fraxineus TaxID=746836 RepID=A0A9N9KM19_9HELO|nr:hypothetical protein HYFRA_00004117 [Hymenoscyphus fraxineus]